MKVSRPLFSEGSGIEPLPKVDSGPARTVQLCVDEFTLYLDWWVVHMPWYLVIKLLEIEVIEMFIHMEETDRTRWFKSAKT